MTAKTAQPTDDPAQAAQAGTPEPRRRVSWRLLLAAAAGMLVAGLAVAHAPFVRSAVARAIVSRVGSGLDTVLALDRLDYNLLTLRFTGTGLSLTAKGSPGPAYFRADRVTVRLRPSALLGHLRFASVELIHPSFTAAREEGGRFNLPHTRPSTGPPAPIEIGRLTVEALDAGYFDAPRLSFVARQLSLDLRPEGSRIRGRLVSAQSGSMRMAPGPEIGFALDGQLEYEPGGVRLNPLTLTTPGAAVRVEGSLVFDTTPVRADLAISGSVGLDLAARLWPALAPARGQVSATMRLAGALSHPTLVFDATAGAASVRALALDGATAHGSLDGSTLTVSPVSLRIAGGRVEGAVSVRLADQALVESGLGRSELQARWDEVDIAALLRSLNVSSSWIAPRARAAGVGKAGWNGSNLSSLSVTATAKIAAPQAHPASAGLAAADLALRVSDSRWTLRVGEVAGAGARITGQLEGPMASGEIARFPIAGRLDAEVRPGELGPWAGSEPAVASALARASGRAAVSLAIMGTLGAPEATAEVTMPDLHVEGFGAGSVRGRVRVDRRHAAIEDLALVLGDSTVRAAGAIPFDGGTPIDARFWGSVGSLLPYVPSAGARWLPAGTIAVAGHVGGSLQRPIVDAAVNGANMSWNDVPLGGAAAEVRIADGRAAGSLSIPSLRATVDGSLSLSASYNYNVSARFDGSDLATMASLAARAGAPVVALTGSARATVRMTGAADQPGPPTVEASVDAVEGAIAGRTLRLDAPTRLLVSSEGLTLQPARLHVDRSVMDASGTLSASAGGSLRVTVDGTIEEWQAWLREASGIPDLEAAGRVRAELLATGPYRQPAIAADVAVSSASASSGSFGAVTGLSARVVVKDERIELVEARGSWAGAPLEARGSMPVRLLERWLPKTQTWRFAPHPTQQATPALPDGLHLQASIASIDKTTLAPWLSAAARDRIEGQLGVTIDLEAPALRLASARGLAVITTSGVSVAGVALSEQNPARVRLENGRVVLEPASWQNRRQAITIGGFVDLNGPHPVLDLALTGAVDLAISRAFVPAAVTGTAALDVRATGEASRPALKGTIEVTDAGIGVASPRIAVSGVGGRVDLDGGRITINASGNANGGTVRIEGLVDRAADGRLSGSIRLQGTDNAIEWPEGLRSSLDIDVTYRVDSDGSLLSGRVLAEPGAYRRAAVPSFATESAPGPASSPSPFDATKLDLRFTTQSPGMIDNSYAELEVEADVVIRGTVGKPAVGGRLTAREGGKVYLRGNNFIINRGGLQFDTGRGGKPVLDLSAKTRRSGYDVALTASGSIDNLRLDFLSDPPLSQSDLRSLITTGSISNSMSRGGSTSSQDAVVAGISSDILGLAGSSIGLDTVRVGQLDMDLIGADVDAETRLTVGKQIGNSVNLLFSQNLRESGLTWVIGVGPFHNVEVRYVSRDSISTSVEVRHEVVFGRPPGQAAAPPRPAKKPEPKISDVTISGRQDVADLLNGTKLRAGDRFDFFEWQRDRERIETRLRDAGYLQSQVSARRQLKDGAAGVTLEYEVRRGPKTTLSISGYPLSGDVVRDLSAAWSRSVDDVTLLADLRDRTRAAMIDEGYFAAKIDSARRPDDRPGEKTVVITIVPGTRTESRRLSYVGNKAISAADLDKEVERRRLDRVAWTDPGVLGPALLDFYRSRGFYAARVAPGQVVVDGTSAQLAVTIVEGPLHRITSVHVVGGGNIDPPQIVTWSGVRLGAAWTASAIEAAARGIEAGLSAAGYLQGHAEVATVLDSETGRVEVVATVVPGKRSVIADVEIVGAVTTRRSIVQRALRLEPGMPAGSATIDAAQRRLYESDSFHSVKVDVEPMPLPSVETVPADGMPAAPGVAHGPGVAQDPGVAQSSSFAANDQPVKATVTLEEAPLYRLRYGVQYTTEYDPVVDESTHGPGLAVEARRRNVFGTAFGAGLGFMLDAQRQSLRGAINIPSSVFWPAVSTVFLTASRALVEGGAVTEKELQFTYQDRWRLGRRVEWSYGYSLSHNDRTGASVASASTDDSPVVSGRISSFYTAIVRDSRDSAFNATRGAFLSGSVEYGGSAIGSDVGFMRYLVQNSHYHKVGPLVLAGAARFGVLANVTGDVQQTYDLTFQAGGDREVRGYAEDSLYPPEVPGVPIGGRALLVLNAEARFPLWKWLKGATFVDAGNAFTDVGAVSLHGLKIGTGFGLRLDTPYALFRVDLGIPMPRDEGLRTRWHFSIGQAF